MAGSPGVVSKCNDALPDPRDDEFIRKAFRNCRHIPGKQDWIDGYSRTARVIAVSAMLFLCTFTVGGLHLYINFSVDGYHASGDIIHRVSYASLATILLGFFVIRGFKIQNAWIMFFSAMFCSFSAFWLSLYMVVLLKLIHAGQNSPLSHAFAALRPWHEASLNEWMSFFALWSNAVNAWMGGMEILFIPLFYGFMASISIGVSAAFPFSGKTRKWLRIYSTKKRVVVGNECCASGGMDFKKIMELPIIDIPHTNTNLFIDHHPDGEHYLSLWYCSPVKIFRFKTPPIILRELRIPLTLSQLAQAARKLDAVSIYDFIKMRILDRMNSTRRKLCRPVLKIFHRLSEMIKKL